MFNNFINNNSNGKFAILASFVRSFDNYHKKKKIMHLVSSVCLFEREDYNWFNTSFKYWLENKQWVDLNNNLKANDYKKYLIVQVYGIDKIIECSEGKTYFFIEFESFILVKVNIDKLFNFLNDSYGDILLFNLLFGSFDLEENNLNLKGSRSLFIFYDLFWSTIVFYFKVNNIDISGGSISKRHIIHSVELQLLFNLIDLFDYNNENLSRLKNIVYLNFNKDILSSSISLELYNNYITNKNKLLNYTWEDIENENHDFFNEEDLSLVSNNKNDVEVVINIIKNNLKFFMLMLINGIKDKLNKEIFDLEKKIQSLVNKIYSLNSDNTLKSNINEISTIHMSTKEKKKFKKEKRIINLDKNLQSKIIINNENITKYSQEKESVSKLLFDKKNDYVKLMNIIKKLTLMELNDLYFNKIKIKSINKFTHNLNPNNSVKGNKIFNREYSTLSIRNNITRNSVLYNNLYNKFNYSKLNFYLNKDSNLYCGSHSLSFKKFYSSENSLKKIDFRIDSPIYIELQRILKNSDLNEETQKKIEQFLNNQGSLLLKDRIDSTFDINYYRINSSLINKLKNSINELRELIVNYKNMLKNTKIDNSVKSIVLLGLSDDEIISNLLGRFLRIMSNNNLINNNTTVTELAYNLADGLINLYKSNKYKNFILENKNNLPDYYGLANYIKEKENDLDLLIINNKLELYTMGFELFQFLIEVNLIYIDTYVSEKKRKTNIFKVHETIVQDLVKYMNLVNLSYKIPMIVKPRMYGRDFTNNTEILGGFLLNNKDYVNPLLIKNPELKEESVIKDDNVIYDLVNNLSSVGYKINNELLDFLLERGLEFDLFINFNLKHPLEIKIEKKEKLTLFEKKTLESFLSRKQLEINVLGLALIFKEVPEFFIPVRLDNRGRVYCNVDYLHYQGIELAKSLLLFSKGEKINKADKVSIDYLKIFGANCYGNGIDKKSYLDRVEWVNNNEDNILNFRNGILIKEAESKILFIAFCFEYIKYKNSLLSNDTFYISHFPIQLDATCNGYQHLSLLTGDEPLAGQLNLLDSDESTIPNDFYSFVALKIKDYLKAFIIENMKICENISNLNLSPSINLNEVETNIKSAKKLLNLNIYRKLVKTVIMVKPYNATLYQMVNYIKDQFDLTLENNSSDQSLLEYTDNNENNNNDELNVRKNKFVYIDKQNKNIKLTANDFFLLVKIIEKIIYTEFPKLKDFNEYLKKVATICNTLNITIVWALPSGLKVNQSYVDSEAIRLRPFKFRKNTFSLKIRNEKINKSKQIRALMPNLIHSLDAASLSLIVDMFFIKSDNNINFFSIHDCFAVTANNVSKLIKIVKLVYIKIYSDDSYLKKFDLGIINSIKLHFGNEVFDDYNKQIKINDLLIQYPNVDVVVLGKIKASQILKAKTIIN